MHLALHSLFQKQKLCIRAATHFNPKNPFGETKLRYTHARAFSNGSKPVGFLWKPTSVCASRSSKIGCMGITWTMPAMCIRSDV